MEGWIKLHRKLLDWEWYDEPNTMRLFIHLVLVATRKKKKWRGITLMPGESMHGLDKLAEGLKLTKDQIRTGIFHLLQTNEITQRRHGKYRIIQVVNYYSYQINPTIIPQESQRNPIEIPLNKKEENSLNRENDKILLDFENIFLSFYANPDASKITDAQKENRFYKISAFFEQQQSWREMICMKTGKPESVIINHQVRFIKKIKIEQGQLLRSIHDLQSYFLNWLEKELRR